MDFTFVRLAEWGSDPYVIGAIAFALIYIASAAGAALPLTLILAMIPSLMVASTLAIYHNRLARNVSSKRRISIAINHHI